MERFISQFGDSFRKVELRDDSLIFEFIWELLILKDYGQSCCEERYMKCDDDLTQFNDSVLRGFEILDSVDTDEDGQAHEILFIRILTSKGSFTVNMHNIHNGYYGGFRPTWIVEAEKPKTKSS